MNQNQHARQGHASAQARMASINTTAQWILEQTAYRPKVGLILGSGLGAFTEALEAPESWAFDEVPGFGTATVSGHAGRLVMGRCRGLEVVVLSGRLHLYEGHSAEDVVFPVRVMRQLGINALIVTNSAGGIDPHLQVGDLMIIKDHINLMGVNPLTGPNLDAFGTRFPDMTRAYNPELRAHIRAAAETLNAAIRSGIYLAVQGPSYETPAEILMMRTVGATAVGMSTVPEVIAAHHAGLRVAGISCISNAAAGLNGDTLLSHDDIKVGAARAKKTFKALLETTLERLKAEGGLDPLPGALV